MISSLMSIILVVVSSSAYILRMSRVSSVGRRNCVRAARRAVDLTQAELADQVGVARQTIVALEAGDYAPSVYLALAISARLDGTTVESLFGEEAQSIQIGR